MFHANSTRARRELRRKRQPYNAMSIYPRRQPLIGRETRENVGGTFSKTCETPKRIIVGVSRNEKREMGTNRKRKLHLGCPKKTQSVYQKGKVGHWLPKVNDALALRCKSFVDTKLPKYVILNPSFKTLVE